MKWLGVALGCVWLAAACTAPAPPAPTPPGSSPTLQATPVSVVQVAQGRLSTVPTPPASLAAAASPVPGALPLSSVAGRSAGDVRVALDLLLQEQVFLGALAIDAAANARLDELGGASDALDQNSMLLSQLVGAVKGQSSAQIFLDGWRGLTSNLILYAQGHQTTAQADIDRRRLSVAEQLAVGDFSESVADDLLHKRMQSLLSLTDGIISHDTSRSYQQLRTTAAASDELALPLARAIAARAPDLGPPAVEGLDMDLRLSLTRELQEHAYLTGAALDAAADGRAADLQAVLNTTDQNAADLGALVAGVYGEDLGSGVAERFKAETAALVSVASGGDRRQAATDLERLRGEVDQLLSAANELLPPDLLGQQLRTSDQALLTAADAFQARDWRTAYARVRESARQTQKPADSLALSIVDRYPGRYLDLPTSAGRTRGHAGHR